MILSLCSTIPVASISPFFPEVPASSDHCCHLAESWSWGSGCPSILSGMTGAVLLGAYQNSCLGSPGAKPELFPSPAKRWK